MKQPQTKKVYIYPIKDNDGTPLDLINGLTHVPDHSTGSLVLDRVDTFIVRNDRGERTFGPDPNVGNFASTLV